MRLLNDSLRLSPLLLLWTLKVLPSHADASINPLHPPLQLPFQIPPQRSCHAIGKPWYSRARNSLMQTIRRIPLDDSMNKASSGDSTTSGPPPTLLARYGGDLVLRFDIASVQEAVALAEAVNVLFLDVWEFTTEWVDVRLSKDVVSLGHPAPMYSAIDIPPSSGPIVAWPLAPVASACPHSSDA